MDEDRQDVPYTNREIRERWHEISNRLQRIETQTTLTNGRVRWLEKMIWLAVGFCACVTLLILPVLLQAVHLS